MLEIKEKAVTNSILDYEVGYKIIGLSFYNEIYSRKEFEEAI